MAAPSSPAPPAAAPNPPVASLEPAVSPPASLTAGDEGGSLTLSGVAARLPVELEVSVAVRDFRVRRLLALAPGQVVETDWVHGDDVPLAAGDVQLAWSEFEVVDAQLAVRITRLP